MIVVYDTTGGNTEKMAAVIAQGYNRCRVRGQGVCATSKKSEWSEIVRESPEAKLNITKKEKSNSGQA